MQHLGRLDVLGRSATAGKHFRAPCLAQHRTLKELKKRCSFPVTLGSLVVIPLVKNPQPDARTRDSDVQLLQFRLEQLELVHPSLQLAGLERMALGAENRAVGGQDGVISGLSICLQGQQNGEKVVEKEPPV